MGENVGYYDRGDGGQSVVAIVVAIVIAVIILAIIF